MTARLHHGDPLRTDFEAQVVSVGADYVVLDRTCFFGPHPIMASDTGLIDRSPTGGGTSTSVGIARLSRLSSGALAHVVDRVGGPGFEVGSPVHGRVDLDRRQRVMRLHTAQHLIDLAAHATHAGVGVALGHVTAETATVYLTPAPVGAASPIDLAAVREAFHDLCHRDLACEVTRSELRPSELSWHLDGYGHRPCDGLHVNSTGMVTSVIVSSAPLGADRVVVTLRDATAGGGTRATEGTGTRTHGRLGATGGSVDPVRSAAARFRCTYRQRSGFDDGRRGRWR